MNEQQEPAAADFLERLVGKARGEYSGLRPRLPSFFEPIRHIRMGSMAAAEAEPTGLLEERADSTPRTARDDSLTRVQQATPTAAEAQPHEAATAHTRRPHEPVQSAATRAETSQVVPATPAPDPLVVASPRGPIEPLAAVQVGLAPTTPRSSDGVAPKMPRLSVAHAVLAEAINDSAPTRNVTHATHTQGEAGSNQSASQHLPAREPVRVGRRVVANEEEGEARLADRLPAKNGALMPSPEPSVRRVVVEALTTRRRSAPEQARVEAPAAAEATPVINVTIGRVEVRAVPPAPPPQRTEARGPRPMSLEEYLKQRGGGR